MRNLLMKLEKVTVWFLLSLIFVSCQSDKKNDFEDVDNKTQLTDLATAERDVILNALQNEKYFSEVASIGFERASDPGLKDLSAKLRSKHTKNLEKFKMISKERGYEVPAKLPNEFEDKLYKLTVANNSDFDKFYFQSIIVDYKSQLDSVAKLINNNTYENSQDVLMEVSSLYSKNLEKLDYIKDSIFVTKK